MLGNAYNDVQEVNVQNYDRFITRLMIEDEEERCVPKNSKKEWKIVTLLCSVFPSRETTETDVEMAGPHEEAAPEKDDSPDGTKTLCH